MPDKPILFSGPMVQALLDGLKTQTRRVLKKPIPPTDADRVFAWHPPIGATGNWAEGGLWADQHMRGDPGGPDHVGGYKRYCGPLPHTPGDRLWVREAHALLPRTAYRMSIGTGTIEQREHPTDNYSAAVFRQGFDRSGRLQWRPSIHMPRWASRLTLIVTDVRVQRLQDISEWDAIAEGLKWYEDETKPERDSGWILEPNKREPGKVGVVSADARVGFEYLWDSINAKRGFGWEENPWVTATTFTVHQCNIDAMEPRAHA
ncbi:MAG: hypothetical protein AAF234_16155 [Pseudomonadota bacterium]